MCNNISIPLFRYHLIILTISPYLRVYPELGVESSQIKEEHELEEHTAFQLHKAVVRHGFRKIRLHRTLNEEQVVVLEFAECTKMEIQQNGHDFTIGQRRLATSTLDSAIVFK